MEQKQMDWNAKLIKFFFERSRLVWLIILLIIVGGIFSLKSLRREGFPAVTPKVVAIQTIYPGAPSEEIESGITKPLEAAVKDIKNLKETSSVSQNSFSNVILTFEESADIDQTVQEVQSKIQSAKNELPKDAEQPKVSTFSTSGPAFFFGITDGGDIEKIRAEGKNLANEISTVKGVKKAKLTQDPANRINISFRPSDMLASEVSLATLNQVLGAASINLPVGTLQSDKEQSISTEGTFGSISDIENLIVGVSKAGKPIFLKDIATVTEAKEDTKAFERFGYANNGKAVAVPGVYLEIEASSTSDIIKTRDAVLAHIEKLRSDGAINKDLKIVPLYDQAAWTQDQIKEILEGAVGAKRNLFILGGLQLLFLAMLIFVNWRSALIAALALPFSLGITFISLFATGTQLNTMVLFCFILVLGLVVDPAIVMVEAIQRYLDLKYSRRDAVLEAGRRYGASLFMAVLTSVLVFLPFGVVSGFLGQIIKYIPITVMPALIASYFVPIALIPFLSSKLLKGHKNPKTASDETDDLNRPAKFVMKINSWVLAKTYRQISILVLTIVLVVLSGMVVAFKKINIVQFAQPEDNVTMQMNGTFAKGLSFEAKNSATMEAEKVVIGERRIKDYFYIAQNGDNFTIYLDLNKKTDFPEKTDSSKEIASRLRSKLAGIKAFDDVTVKELSIGPPTSDFQISVQLADNDLAKLKSGAIEVGKFLKETEHVTKIDDGFTDKGVPSIKIVLDRSKVEKSGLSSLQVGMQLKAALDETKVAKYKDGSSGEQQDIYLVNDTKTKSVSELQNLPLASTTGTLVKLGDVAEIKEVDEINAIERYNGSRFATVKARVDKEENVAAVQKKLNDYLTDSKLKELGIDSKLSKGDIADMTKSFTDLGIALVIAILLTYVVLVLQFGSFSLPAIMIFTVPLSFIGVFPALWATKSDFGFLELIGITILVGIVENVAIFLIDYANQLRKEKGLSAKEAIIAASGVRFRPILLTKLVALGGLLPLAIESDFWRGLSVVIIAGIGLSGFFSLITIPVLYVWISGLRNKVSKQA